MKLISVFLLCATGASLLSGCASRAVVKQQPATPVVVVPAAPYHGAVLVGDEWRWRRGRYVYVAPHYVKANRARVWVPGHWRNAPRGYVWVKGRWS